MSALPFSVAQQAQTIKAAITKYSVPAQVFMGMYEQETSLGANISTSSASAVGPFQFTSADKGVGVIYPMTNTPTLTDFQQQAYAAAALLASNFKQEGSWQNALAAYNAGPGNIGAGEGYASAALAFTIPVEWSTALGSAASSPVAGGGVFGAGGTGTAANRASLWTVGDPSNPDQDYWTTINQYSMDAQWYTFSDAETLFVTDGIQLMGQQPRAVIRRTDPAVIHAECTYDNTAFQFAATHKHRNRVQRRTSLARLTSPTEVTLQIICDIDQFRAGDTAHLVFFGPADGVWLIGDCVREAFLPYSELTLVQAMQPINAATGLASGPAATTGAQASRPGAGTVIAAMISEASTLNNDNYPYVYAGGHAQAGTPSIGSPGNGYDGHTKGFDCSGAVAAVLAAGGLWQIGSGVPADNGIISQLQSENKIVGGQGSGSPECTLFDNPGVHIFMRLNSQYFGTEDGAGHLPATPSQGAGWIPNGQPGSFIPYHVPQSILGQQAA